MKTSHSYRSRRYFPKPSRTLLSKTDSFGEPFYLPGESKLRKEGKEMYKKIMVPLDGSKLAECVFPHVESLVKAGQVGEVVFVRVVEPYNFSLMSGEEVPKPDDIVRFQNVADRAKSNGVTVRGEILIGRPSVKLAEYANNGGFDLVIIATHGRSGVSRWVWGSVADRLLRAVCLPILMVRAPGCVPGI
jgi:nucleotide-binding universal stress UspA family protein